MPQKYKISFSSIMPDLKDYIRNNIKGHNIEISDKPLDLNKIKKDTEILGVFVDSKIDKTVFEALPKLKMITTFSTGFDHIDLAEAKKRKVTVCNVPTYGENTVAQHAMSLMLALSRKLFQSVKIVKEGIYDYHNLCGFDLKGKTIGVIGTGHIGIHLIDMLQGFEANVIAYDAFPNPELEKTHKFQYVSLNKLYNNSDIISLHVPLFPTTYHMIDKSAVKKMKDGVYIINTARGGLTDPEALVWGLENNKIAGVGTDVLEEETYFQNPQKVLNLKNTEELCRTLMENVLIDHPNTIVTPHNAFNSIEALKRIADTSLANIKAFTSEKVQNDVMKK